MDAFKNPLVSRRGFLGAAGALAACAVTGCQTTMMKTPAQPLRRRAMFDGVSVDRSLFGVMHGGQRVDLYTVRNRHGGEVRFITFGARVNRIRMPDAHGNPGDIALGFDSLDPYLSKKDPYFGATVGRVANRIGNHRFMLDGRTYTLSGNEHHDQNTLHGGKDALDRQVWDAYVIHRPGAAGVRFKYFSPAMQNGFPGNVHFTADYMLTTDNQLLADLYATTDQATPINMTNHTYFNLRGPGRSIQSQRLQVYSDYYTPVNKQLLPTGRLAPVRASVLDFRHLTTIGKNIKEVPSPVDDRGYDHNYVIRGGGKGVVVPAARVEDPETGRTMEVYSNQPGLQFYTGNFLDGTFTGYGGTYRYQTAYTLEPQDFPDAINRRNFPPSVLQPGQLYHEIIRYKFGRM